MHIQVLCEPTPHSCCLCKEGHTCTAALRLRSLRTAVTAFLAEVKADTRASAPATSLMCDMISSASCFVCTSIYSTDCMLTRYNTQYLATEAHTLACSNTSLHCLAIAQAQITGVKQPCKGTYKGQLLDAFQENMYPPHQCWELIHFLVCGTMAA